MDKAAAGNTTLLIIAPTPPPPTGTPLRHPSLPGHYTRNSKGIRAVSKAAPTSHTHTYIHKTRSAQHLSNCLKHAIRLWPLLEEQIGGKGRRESMKGSRHVVVEAALTCGAHGKHSQCAFGGKCRCLVGSLSIAPSSPQNEQASVTLSQTRMAHAHNDRVLLRHRDVSATRNGNAGKLTRLFL